MSLEHNITTSAVAAPEHLPEKQEEGGLLVINGTIIVIIASFIIFTLLMQAIFYGPITEIRRKRKEYIKKLKTEADSDAEEAAKLENNYNHSLKDARKKASDATTETLNQANTEKSKLLDEKKQFANQFLNDQKQIIHGEKDNAINELKGQVMDYAYRISCKVLGEGVSMAGISPEIVDKAIASQE
jgi:F-type H+-transporting ATPase subunit b